MRNADDTVFRYLFTFCTGCKGYVENVGDQGLDAGQLLAVEAYNCIEDVFLWSRDIALCYGLDDRGFESR